MLQAVGAAAPAAAQPAFDGTLYVVASRGLQLMSPDGELAAVLAWFACALPAVLAALCTHGLQLSLSYSPPII
jgi:hypothetical protein